MRNILVFAHVMTDISIITISLIFVMSASISFMSFLTLIPVIYGCVLVMRYILLIRHLFGAMNDNAASKIWLLDMHFYYKDYVRSVHEFDDAFIEQTKKVQPYYEKLYPSADPLTFEF